MKREQLIDFFRGITIIDMMLVHYSIYFNTTISKIINYHDFAMEAFLFIAGFMIGTHYLKEYEVNKILVIKKIYIRITKIIIIQYFLIIFVSLPLWMSINGYNSLNQIFLFLLKSITFYNQVGIIHILPTFIPLFVISPLILLLLDKNYDILVIILSVSFFSLGQIDPFLFNYGEKTIFPVILWQIYFVLGSIFGKLSVRTKYFMPKKKTLLFVLSISILSIVLIIKHFRTLLSPFQFFNFFDKVIFYRFPLNIPGLFFGAALLLFIYTFFAIYWEDIKKFKLIFVFSTFGRNSLLAFSIHVFFAKFIILIRGLNELWLIYIVIAGNFIFGYWSLKNFEEFRRKSNPFLRILKWVF